MKYYFCAEPQRTYFLGMDQWKVFKMWEVSSSAAGGELPKVHETL
jgi:hypothetical protein